jgi:hypothetical protein
MHECRTESRQMERAGVMHSDLRKRLYANGYRPVAVTSPWCRLPRAGRAPDSEMWRNLARQNPPAAVIDPVILTWPTQAF